MTETTIDKIKYTILKKSLFSLLQNSVFRISITRREEGGEIM